jgi:AcrR family transcriptional regulator
MTQVVRPYRGVSAEERRTERRTRLIDACLEVVGTEGVAGTTVDRVCASAGLTKRYFYESFGDLETLLLAAADDMFADLYGGMADAARGIAPGPDSARAAVSSVVMALTAHPARARLYVESPGHPALRARRDQAVDAFVDFVATNVVTTERDSPGLMLRVRLIVAGATDLMTGMLRGTVDAEVDDVVDAVVRVSVDL